MASAWGNSWLTSWGDSWGSGGTPPVVETFSGGYSDYGTLGERRKRKIPPEVAAVIEQVAISQVQTLEADAQKQKRELQLRLRLKDLRFEVEYLQALAERREALIDAALAHEMKMLHQHNDDAIAVILIMATLDS